MASFKIISKSKTKSQNDYFTPRYAWNHIKDYIPKNKVIWEAFYNSKSNSPQYLKDLGFNVVAIPYNKESGEGDFFNLNLGDIIVSNPPFTEKKQVLRRLKELNKPFILIMPVSTITNQYFRELFLNDKELGIIIPKKRINFYDDVKSTSITKCGACFDTYYYCWKVGITGINWIK